MLTENSSDKTTDFNIFYYFDNNSDNKKTIKLAKCSKCSGECYCATIDLDEHSTIHFGFSDSNNCHEMNSNIPFKMEIAKDPLTDILQRYGFEQNVNLPTCEQKHNTVFVFKNILIKIKSFLDTLIRHRIVTQK